MPGPGETTVVPAPHLFPGKCRACGGIGEQIDFGVHDRLGRLYICTKVCAPRVAMALGYVDAETHANDVAIGNDLSAIVTELNAQLEYERSPEAKLVSVPELVEHLSKTVATK